MAPLRERLLRPWVVMPAVALVGLGGWLVVRPDGGTDEASAAAAETVVEATTGTMAQTVSAEGTLTPARTDDLSFGAAGTVTSVRVEAGDEVRAGQVLASIDSAELELAVADAETALAEAEATLADDQSAGESDDQLEAGASAVVAAQDSVASAREDLEGAELTATFDGTVAAVNVVEGEELASGGVGGTDTTGSDSGSGDSSSTLADPATGDTGDTGTTDADIQVVDTDHYTVDLGFDEADVAELELGQEATVTLTTSSSSTTGFPGGGAFPGGQIPGGFVLRGGATDQATGDQATENADAGDATTTSPSTSTGSGPSGTGVVWEVGRVADASSGVALFPVTVLFEDTAGDFDAGATVSVAITYAEVTDVVQVPTLAVTTAEDGTTTVTVRGDDGDETRTVTTGLTSGTMTEISSGLEAGEQVVLAAPAGFTRGGELPDGVEVPEGFPGAAG